MDCRKPNSCSDGSPEFSGDESPQVECATLLNETKIHWECIIKKRELTNWLIFSAPFVSVNCHEDAACKFSSLSCCICSAVENVRVKI